jgi:hypothetical protein
MITDPDIQFVIKKPICDGIGNVIKSFITAYSVNTNSKIDCNSDYLLGVYDTVLDEKHIYKENPNITPKYMYTSRLLVLPEEENEQQHIFSAENYEVNGCGNNDYNYLYSFQRLIDYNYDPDRICERVKKRIIGAIEKIKFLPFIENKVLENIKNISENSLAISIRTWKCFHETNINREYNSEVYKEKIRDVILAVNPDKILISFDNHDYEEEYISFLKSFNIPLVILNKETDTNDLQHAFIKMLSLSSCRYFIGNRISTFSELVWWFSKCKIKVFPLF